MISKQSPTTPRTHADELLTIKEASNWATEYLGKTVTPSNISYLIQYGRIKKNGANGSIQVSKQELIKYYKSYNGQREVSWKGQLGDDLNWYLSFDQYKEADTTKHVHRLYPQCEYMEGIAAVFRNALPLLKPNDKFFEVGNRRLIAHNRGSVEYAHV